MKLIVAIVATNAKFPGLKQQSRIRKSNTKKKPFFRWKAAAASAGGGLFRGAETVVDDGGDLHSARLQARVNHGGHDALQELQEAVATGDKWFHASQRKMCP